MPMYNFEFNGHASVLHMGEGLETFAFSSIDNALFKDVHVLM